MTIWRTSDGTTMASGKALAVRGSSRFAKRLELLNLEPPTVDVLPEPSPGVPFDPSNDWLCDRVIRQLAERYGLTVSADYEPRDDDAPEAARELLRIWDENDANDPGVDSHGRPRVY